MFIAQMQDELELFVCTFEITVGDSVQHQTLKAPRIIFEEQFKALARDAAYNDKPMKVKLMRMVPIYNQFEHQWIEQELSIAFSNNAYIAVHPNEFE